MADKVRHYGVEFRPVNFGDASIRGISPTQVYEEYLKERNRKGRDYKLDLYFKRLRLALMELESK